VASRLPSAAPTESRLGRCDAADAVADDCSRYALPTGIRCGRSRSGNLFRHRRAVFVQSTVDRPQPTTIFGVPSTPWTAAAFTRTERLSVPLLRGWPSTKVVFPSSRDAVTSAAATSTAAQPYPTTTTPTTTTTTTFAASVCVRQAPAVQITRKPSPGR